LKVGEDRGTCEFYPDLLQQIPTEQSERDEELNEHLSDIQVEAANSDPRQGSNNCVRSAGNNVSDIIPRFRPQRSTLTSHTKKLRKSYNYYYRV
jgi:hypothetical protein